MLHKNKASHPRHNEKWRQRRRMIMFLVWRGGSSFKSRRGQLIVEAMVAISVLLVGFLGVLALLSQSLATNRVVVNNYTATYLAAEGIEIVKNIIDYNAIQINDQIQKKQTPTVNWDDGLLCGQSACDYQADYLSLLPLSSYSGQPQPLNFDSNTNSYKYTVGLPTNFMREIKITPVYSDGKVNEVRVNSIITWSTGLAQSSINLEDLFFNWRP